MLFPIEIAVSVEGFSCFVRMDLLQLTNTCGLQDGKSFNFNGIFNWKWPGVLVVFLQKVVGLALPLISNIL